MGVGVSNWRLARAVSAAGQLGVVSGTALDQVMIRRLSDGDGDGAMRRALEAFPFRRIAERIVRQYFVPGGKPPSAPYPAGPLHRVDNPRQTAELCMTANFAEIFLARLGHSNPVGINFLEKVQLPHLPSLYGAMLAGVSYVLVGAGIPLQFPGVLDALAAQRPAEYRMSIAAAADAPAITLRFDPLDYVEGPLPQLARPRFLAIVSSTVLAATLLRRASGRVDGFIVESPIAGGHNAPPRGKLHLNAAGEPIYGERDEVKPADLRELGVPFWRAGGYGSPAKLQEALAAGATGVQVGTAFAFTEESGLRDDMKAAVLAQAATASVGVFTDPLASPTGFPFKVAQLAGTLAEDSVFARRRRVCDLGFLRESYARLDGSIGYRCPAEPPACYVSKGGSIEDTTGRKCLCNALLANIGLAQVRPRGYVEPALVTLGSDVNAVAGFLRPGRTTYTAVEVLETLMSEVPVHATTTSS